MKRDEGATRKAQAMESQDAFHDVLLFADDWQRAADEIRKGFPATILKDTSVYFDVPSTWIQSIAQVPEATASSLLSRGAHIDTAASERIWRLANVASMANEVFEDEDAAKAWLRTPNKAFQDLAPMKFVNTEPGAMSVRLVLNAIATGGVL